MASTQRVAIVQDVTVTEMHCLQCPWSANQLINGVVRLPAATPEEHVKAYPAHEIWARETKLFYYRAAEDG